MSTFSVGGLASGLDTKSIISQLVAIDTRPKTMLEWKNQLLSTRKSVWTDMNTKLRALQTAGNAIYNPTAWNVAASSTGPLSATSGDPSRLSATVGATAVAGTYALQVSQLAQAEISQSTGSLGPATAGRRTTGAWYEGAANIVEGNENITALRTSAGATMGLNTNSTITMSYAVNGVPQSADFKVNTAVNGGQGTTLTQFAAWVASTIGSGATASFNGAGQLQVTTGAGTALELDSLSFSAVNAANAALPAFNSAIGASSTQTVAATDGGVSSNETMTITNGSGSWNVALATGDTLQDIANKINATGGIGVIASINSGALRLQSTSTGATNAFTVSSTGTTAGLLGFTETQAAQDALYSVDGTSYSSSKNSGVTGAITDVTLNFTGTTSTTLTVAAGAANGQSPQEAWIDGMVSKIKDFVGQYNAILGQVYQKTQAESRVTSPANKTTGMTLSEYLQGPMARNREFGQIAFDMRNAANTAVTGMTTTGGDLLSSIGITTSFDIGAKATNGNMVIDETKLKQALRDDPAHVQELLTKVGTVAGEPSADDGILRRITDTAFQISGRISDMEQSFSSQAKTVQSSIDRQSQRIARKQAYYERMFSAMEAAMGKAQSQGSWLSGQISAMNGGSDS